MTEQEWLTSDNVQAMVNLLTRRPGATPANATGLLAVKTSDRKLRLFACACCRQPEVWDGVECGRCKGSGSVPGNPAMAFYTVACPDCHGTGRVGGLTDDVPCEECAEIERRVEAHVRTGGSRETANLMRKVRILCKTCKGSGRINRSRRAVEVAERFADGLATKAELNTAWQFSGPSWTIASVASHPTDGETADWAANQIVGGNVEGPCPDRITQAALLREIVGNPFRPQWISKNGQTITEVLKAQGSVIGCCDHHADNQACDCLQLAGTVLPEWLTHNDGLVPRLAASIYESRRFEELPILTDALEEAGCSGEVEVQIEVGVHVYANPPDGWVVCVSAPELMPRSPRQVYINRRREISVQWSEKNLSVRWGKKHLSRSGACWGDGTMTIKQPNPILAHLRDPGLHVRGCWVLDLLLGKE